MHLAKISSVNGTRITKTMLAGDGWDGGKCFIYFINQDGVVLAEYAEVIEQKSHK